VPRGTSPSTVRNCSVNRERRPGVYIVERTKGQRMVIVLPGGTRLTVELMEARAGHQGGASARLGFELPPDVSLYREEVLEQIEADAAKAAWVEASTDTGEPVG